MTNKWICYCILICFLTSFFLSVPGCVATEESVKTIKLDEPKSSVGILVKDPETGNFDKIVDMLEAQKEQSVRVPKADSIQASPVETTEPDVPDEIGLPYSYWPEGTGRLFNLPKLNDVELGELLTDIVLNFQTNQGFQEANEETAAKIPNLPPDIDDEVVLSKDVTGGKHIIRIGYWTYKARPPRLGVYAAILNSENVLNAHTTRVNATQAKTSETKKTGTEVQQEVSKAKDEISKIMRL